MDILKSSHPAVQLISDKKSFFLSQNIGDFALCVKGKVDASCGGPPC